MHRPFAPSALLAALLVLAVSPVWAGANRTARASRQGDQNPPNRPDSRPEDRDARAAREVVTPSGLRYLDLVAGQGAEAAKGKTVDVLYTGWLEDGTQFDASQDPARPFTFRIDIDEVIRGWHEGVAGMKVGGRRRLVIPPDLGYGKQGAGGVVPPNATLVFEIELLDVR